MQRFQNYSADTLQFPPHRYQIEKIIAAQAGVVTPSYIDGPAHGVVTSGGAFYGGCLMRNGKALLSPSSTDNIFLFNPVTNLLEIGPLHGETKAAFIGAISVSETLVVLPPDSSANIGLYNPTTNTYTRGPAKPQSTLKYSGGCMMPDGRVLLAPLTATKAAIYNPFTNTVTESAATMTGRAGAQLMPNGLIILPPTADTGDGFKIYYPETDTVVDMIGTYPETRDLVPIADGRMATVPADLARVFLFDFRYSDINPITTGTDIFTANATNKFWGGALAANGDVIFAPYARNKIGYYRPPTLGQPNGQVFDGPDMPADSVVERFTGCVPLPDGRFLFVPRKHPYVGIYTHLAGGQPLPPEVLMSPFYSNSF